MRFNCAAVQLNELANNRQSEAKAAMRSGCFAVALTKPIKNVGQKLTAYPFT
jgi:hypothetical protein